MKEEVIKRIREADITQMEWEYAFLNIMTDKYAKGYLEATIGQLNNEGMSYSSEDFRNELLETCEWDIWNK